MYSVCTGLFCMYGMVGSQSMETVVWDFVVLINDYNLILLFSNLLSNMKSYTTGMFFACLLYLYAASICLFLTSP